MSENEARANGIQLAKFQEWLIEQPPIIAGIFGSRLGLRMLPLAVDLTNEGQLTERQKRHIITAFRYAALGWLATLRPNPGLEVISTAVNTVSPRQTSAASAVLFEGHAAALSVIKATKRGFYAEIPAFRFNHAASIAIHYHPEFVLEPIAFERAWIESGGELSALLRMPAWPNLTSPNLLPPPYDLRWETMRSVLERDDLSWKVWTAWYQDRLEGLPLQSEEFEYFRLTTIENAVRNVESTSLEDLRLLRQEVETISNILRKSPRKINRVVAAYIASRDPPSP